MKDLNNQWKHNSEFSLYFKIDITEQLTSEEATAPQLNDTLIILARKDIKSLQKGKMSAQIGHAVSDTIFYHKKYQQFDIITKWKEQGYDNIIYECNLQQLTETLQIADKLNISCDYIQDAGHTQIESGTITVGWIGPIQYPFDTESQSELQQALNELKVLE